MTFVASDLTLHCLPMSHKKDARLTRTGVRGTGCNLVTVRSTRCPRVCVGGGGGGDSHF